MEECKLDTDTNREYKIHPYLSELDCVLTQFHSNLQRTVDDNSDRMSYCFRNIIKFMKLRVFNIALDILTCKIHLNEHITCCRNGSIYDTYKHIRKYLDSVNGETQYYNRNICNTYSLLIEGYYLDMLKHIDDILSTDEDNISKTISCLLALSELFDICAIQATNVQVDCYALQKGDKEPKQPIHKHRKCSNDIASLVMIVVSKSHFKDPKLLLKLMRLIDSMDIDNILLCLEFRNIDKYISVDNCHIKLIDRFKKSVYRYNTYYFTNVSENTADMLNIHSSRIINTKEELSLVNQYWRKERKFIDADTVRDFIKNK